MIARSRRSSARGLFGAAATSVSAGPITTSTPAISVNRASPPAMASKGDGYQTSKTTKAMSAATAALIRR